MKAVCIKILETKYRTFKPTEEVDVREANKSWYIIDAIGVDKEKFKDHFIWKQ